MINRTRRKLISGSLAFIVGRAVSAPETDGECGAPETCAQESSWLQRLMTDLNHSGIANLPAGQFDATIVDSLLVAQKPMAIRGAGSARSVIRVTGTGSNGGGLFQVLADGFELSGVTVLFQSGSRHSLMLAFAASSRGHRFQDVIFEGIPDEIGGRPHGISFAPDASVEDVQFHQCRFAYLGYGIFTPNTFKGRAQGWRIVDCDFDYNSADDLELNSSDNPARTWDGVVVTQCRFQRNHDNRTTTGGFALGTDSGSNIQFTNNQIRGYSREVVHIEDFCQSISIADNIIEDCDGGIMIYENNSSNILVTGNILRRRRVARSVKSAKLDINQSVIGLYLANPRRRSSASEARIDGNIVSGYDIGIYSATDRGGQVTNNTINDCGTGIFVPAGTGVRNSDNLVVNSDFAAYSAGGSIGRLVVEDCSSLVASFGQLQRFSEGFVWTTTAARWMSTGAGSNIAVEVSAPLSRIPGLRVSVRLGPRDAYDEFTVAVSDRGELRFSRVGIAGQSKLTLRGIEELSEARSLLTFSLATTLGKKDGTMEMLLSTRETFYL